MQEVEGEYEVLAIEEKDKTALVAYTLVSEDEYDSSHIAYLEKDDKEWRKLVTAVCDKK